MEKDANILSPGSNEDSSFRTVVSIKKRSGNDRVVTTRKLLSPQFVLCPRPYKHLIFPVVIIDRFKLFSFAYLLLFPGRSFFLINSLFYSLLLLLLPKAGSNATVFAFRLRRRKKCIESSLRLYYCCKVKRIAIEYNNVNGP